MNCHIYRSYVFIPETPWQSVTIEGLERALTDLHCNIRLAATVSCASGAVNRPREEPTPIDAGQLTLQH